MPPIVTNLLWLFVVFLILGVGYWLFTYLVGLFGIPDPIPKFGKAAFVVVCVIVIVAWLLSLLGLVNVFPGYSYRGLR